MEVPSPVISVVTPWVILLAARLSTSTLNSDWPCTSINPGATTSPFTSTRFFADALPKSPMAPIRSPLMPRSPATHGAPVPSIMRAFDRMKSNSACCAGAYPASSRTAIEPASSEAASFQCKAHLKKCDAEDDTRPDAQRLWLLRVPRRLPSTDCRPTSRLHQPRARLTAILARPPGRAAQFSDFEIPG